MYSAARLHVCCCIIGEAEVTARTLIRVEVTFRTPAELTYDQNLLITLHLMTLYWKLIHQQELNVQKYFVS